MRILVLSDIHGNLVALERVLEHAGAVDAVWCLGDLVGYGAQPNECVERVAALPNLACVRGNHDAAILGHFDLDAFNSEARASIGWTNDHLHKPARSFLEQLPALITLEKVTLVHGSPRSPEWEYILDLYTAEQNLNEMETPLCFVGHTHQPMAFFFGENGRTQWLVPRPEVLLRFRLPVILNPGSVGQPRDHDPRAAYAIFDSEESTWQSFRVAYDVLAAQDRIYSAGLPVRHALRLQGGW
jgi:putative phosphoesterase